MLQLDSGVTPEALARQYVPYAAQHHRGLNNILLLSLGNGLQSGQPNVDENMTGARHWQRYP